VEEGHNEKIWSLRELPNDINLQQKSEVLISFYFTILGFVLIRKFDQI